MSTTILKQRFPGDGLSVSDVPISDPHIIFDDVTYSYGPEAEPAIHNVSLKIPRGKITAVIGASGSGKSTLIKALTGVSKAERDSAAFYSGDMYVCSYNIDDDGKRVDPQFDDDGNPVSNTTNIKDLVSFSRQDNTASDSALLNGDVFVTVQQKPELPPLSIEEMVDHGARAMDAKYGGMIASTTELFLKVALAGRGNGVTVDKPWISEDFDETIARICKKFLRRSFGGKWISHEADARISYRLSQAFGVVGFPKPEEPDYQSLRRQDVEDSNNTFLAKRQKRLDDQKARIESNKKEPLRIAADRRENVEKALEGARIMDDLKQQGKALHDGAKKLSGGQQQRVFVAAALNVQSEILLADEATSSTDPISTLGIENTINDIHTQRTVLWVSHDMQQVARLTHRVVVMHLGRVAIEGPTKDVFLNPTAFIRKDLPDTEDFSQERLLWVFDQYVGRFGYVFRDTEYDGAGRDAAVDYTKG